jgi:hypothetical protein
MRAKNAIPGVLGPVLVLIVGTAVAIMLAKAPGGGSHLNKLPPWWTRDSETQPQERRKLGAERLENYRSQPRPQAGQGRSAPGRTWSDHATADRTLETRKLLRSNLLLVAAIVATGIHQTIGNGDR